MTTNNGHNPNLIPQRVHLDGLQERDTMMLYQDEINIILRLRQLRQRQCKFAMVDMSEWRFRIRTVGELEG